MKELKTLYAIITQMVLDGEINSTSAKTIQDKITIMLRDKQTDKIEIWWNNLSDAIKTTYIHQTFSFGLFEDNSISYTDIEVMYNKYKDANFDKIWPKKFIIGGIVLITMTKKLLKLSTLKTSPLTWKV